MNQPAKRPLLAIISCPKDTELIERHWPYFKRAECDIVGCGSEDGKTIWPEDVPQLNTGVMGLKPMTIGGKAIFGLCKQELDILAAFLETDYPSCAIVESDNLIVRRFPDHPGKLILAPIVPNLQKSGFTTSTYLSTPRFYCRESAGHILHHGRQLMKEGRTEHDCSDRFIALAAQRSRVRFMNFGWTQLPMMGVGDRDFETSFIRDARVAISLGAPSIHGVKTQHQLEEIMKGNNEIKEEIHSVVGQIQGGLS